MCVNINDSCSHSILALALALAGVAVAERLALDDHLLVPVGAHRHLAGLVRDLRSAGQRGMFGGVFDSLWDWCVEFCVVL